jgi:hypothetical protein
MLTNKWVLVALGALTTLVGYFGTVDWNTMLPSDAGGIVIVIGAVKFVLASLMPPVGQANITKTAGTFFTHT